MKRSRLRRQSKSTLSKIQRELWELCKQITRKKYQNSDGTWDCYTCESKNIDGSNLHTGHMIPKSVLGAEMKYDLRVLRPQCMACNCHRGGMGAEFVRRMIVREGSDYVDQIYTDKAQKPINARAHYEYLIEKYKIILDELK